MGYDLNFWKYQPGKVLDHLETYQKLSDGKEVDGLEELPIEKITERVKQVFATWEQLDWQTWQSANGSFQIYVTPQLFRVDCYGMNGDDMNLFIDIGAEFGCPLYDPQVNQRFDGS